eukprot:5070847-Prymnesium_polylepis.1
MARMKTTSKVVRMMVRGPPPRPSAATTLQAHWRGHNYRRQSVMDREPRPEILLRWQKLVSRALARVGGINWEAIGASLSVLGFVPVTDEAIEAMMVKQRGYSYQTICSDARQSRLLPTTIETTAGDPPEARRQPEDADSVPASPGLAELANEQPELLLTERNLKRFRVKQAPRPKLPPIIDSSLRFVMSLDEVELAS